MAIYTVATVATVILLHIAAFVCHEVMHRVRTQRRTGGIAACWTDDGAVTRLASTMRVLRHVVGGGGGDVEGAA